MRLFLSQGTNPHIVQRFLEQTKIDIECVWIDISKGENRTDDCLSKNPLGQLAVLKLNIK